MKKLILAIFLMASNSILFANDTLQIQEEISDEQYQELWTKFKDSIEQTFVYELGEVIIKDDLAKINVPDGFKYLNGEQSEMILTDIWGNPPSSDENKSLGMLIPADDSPLDVNTYAINVTYTADGFVDDDDAAKIDYDDLLNTMQEDTEAGNAYRVEQGYVPIELLGWASQPFYDGTTKKLHWAKELRFGEIPTNTLNYNIRILGRKGYLELNAIGDMTMVDKVKNGISPILENVDFLEGNRYEDFDPKYDEIAAYGIGGLIAGKVLLKAGILAKVGLMLAKFWKIIAIAVVGFFAGFKKFFGKKEESDSV